MDRRAQLEGWIASTRRTQRRLSIALVAGAAIGIGLVAWQTAVGVFTLLSVALLAICGYWITGSHLADWRRQLGELDRPKPQPRPGARYER